MDGRITEYPIPAEAGMPSPINIAVGPDRNIWFTKGPMVVRVTRDGTMTPFRLPGDNAGGTGLTSGSDRQPPARLTNKLWVAESGANTIAALNFK
jgi:streptogramin lyase